MGVQPPYLENELGKKGRWVSVTRVAELVGKALPDEGEFA